MKPKVVKQERKHPNSESHNNTQNRSNATAEFKRSICARKGMVTTTNQDIQRGLDWVISQRAEPIDNPASQVKYSIPPTIIKFLK